MSQKHLSILGSTGSIGRQTLNVVESLPDQFKIVALAAGTNLDELLPQIERHHPEVISVATAQLADDLATRLRERNVTPLPHIHHGAEGMLAVATHSSAEIVLSAAVGVVGLEATYEAVKLGRTVALSNKEVLVAAGELVMAAAAKSGRELLPVDSEHNAVHQCLRAGRRSSHSGDLENPSFRAESAERGILFDLRAPQGSLLHLSSRVPLRSPLTTHHPPRTSIPKSAASFSPLQVARSAKLLSLNWPTSPSTEPSLIPTGKWATASPSIPPP